MKEIWKTILIILAVIVVIGGGLTAFFIFTKSEVKTISDGGMLVIHYLDENGNEIPVSSGVEQSTIGGVQGIQSFFFEIRIQNTGGVPLQNVRLSSITPPELNTALSGAAPVNDFGATTDFVSLWNSSPMQASQFEARTQPVRFDITISADFANAQGVTTPAQDQSDFIDLTIGPDVCSDGTVWGACSTNQPKKCVSGSLVDTASECGCPAGYTANGEICEVNTCSDGTVAGQCVSTSTTTNLRFCDPSTLTLVEACGACGCVNDFYGNPSIGCSVQDTCNYQNYQGSFLIQIQ